MATMNDLPDEVLLCLFSKLTLPTRKCVRQVCRRWLEVCNSARVTKHELIRIHKAELSQFTIGRTNLNLRVCGRKNPSCNLQFWQEHGNSVKSLNLQSYELSELFDILRCCPNLEHLVIYYGSFEAGHPSANIHVGETVKLDCLLSLSIKYVDLNCDNFWRYIDNLPELEECSTDFYEPTVSNGVMTQILGLSSNLTELFFTECRFVTEKFLETILEKIGHQLTGLYLARNHESSDRCLTKFAKKLIKLENLELNRSFLTEHNFPDFFMPLRNLKLISLRDTCATDSVLSIVASLENLKGLDIGMDATSRVCITANGFLKAFGQKSHPNLIDIRLSNLEFVTDDVLAIVLPQLPNLECLDLMGCRDISEEGVSAIVTNCKRLKYLSFAYCDEISTLIEPVSINSLQSLVHLNLFCCQWLDWMSVNELKLGLLKTIELGNVHLTEERLYALMVNCPSLQRVHLSMDDEGLVEGHETCYQTCMVGTFERPLKPASIFKFHCFTYKPLGYDVCCQEFDL